MGLVYSGRHYSFDTLLVMCYIPEQMVELLGIFYYLAMAALVVIAVFYAIKAVKDTLRENEERKR